MWSKFLDDWLLLHEISDISPAWPQDESSKLAPVFPAASTLLSLYVQFIMSCSVYAREAVRWDVSWPASVRCSHQPVSVQAICLRWWWTMADQLLSVYNTLDSSSSFLTRPSAGKKSDSNTLAHTWLSGPSINLTLRIISIKLNWSASLFLNRQTKWQRHTLHWGLELFFCWKFSF